MDSARFRYSPEEGGGSGGRAEEESMSSSRLLELEDDDEAPCYLDITVHHARGIHNICIYADQDVYARLALTSAPDDGAATLATRVAPGGGSSPRFDERLRPLRVRRGRLAVDVLKCELWMRSCARGALEDQLLGFALVPLADVAAADGVRLDARDFEVSSTDLIHSPAGTVRLSLALHAGLPPGDAAACPPPPERSSEPSITSEVVILEPRVDYSRIEFPDLNAVKEHHDMAVQYLPFLQLGRPEAMLMEEDWEDGSKNASTASTVSDDRAAMSSSSPEPAEKPPPGVDGPAMSCRSPDTPTSCRDVSQGGGDKEKAGDVFKSPLGDIDMEAEQSAMQRQIMEMYVKSMQQFSESLAEVKLPMELDVGDGVVVQKEEKPDTEAIKKQQQGKKEGARVFYGSRAFF